MNCRLLITNWILGWAVGFGYRLLPDITKSFDKVLKMGHVKLAAIICTLIIVFGFVNGKDNDPAKKNVKPKKDLRDYTDADMERLYEEWEVKAIKD